MDLSFRTKNERKIEMNIFKKYVSVQAGRHLGEVLSAEDGRDVVQEMFFGFFSTFRLKDGKLPSRAYIGKLRSSVLCSMIEEYKTDLQNKEHCPEFNKRWNDILSCLNNLVCRECGIEFTERRDLMQHRETHTGEKSYNCKKCPARFMHNRSLERHMQEKCHE